MDEDVFIVDAVRTPLARAGGPLTEVLPSRLVAGLLECVGGEGGASEVLSAFLLAGDGPADTAGLALAAAGRRSAACWQMQGDPCGLEVLRQAVLQIAAPRALHPAGPASGKLAVAGGYRLAGRRGPLDALDVHAAMAWPVLPSRLAADLLASRHDVTAADLDAWADRSSQAARQGPWATAGVHAVRDINGLAILVQDPPGGMGEADEPDADGTPDALAIALRHDPMRRELACRHARRHLAAQADGAALVLLGDAQAVERLGVAPCAKVRASLALDAGPARGFEAAGQAVREVLNRTGWDARYLDALEIHDPCAAVAWVTARQLGVPLDRVNAWGGALAHGDAGPAAGALCIGRLLGQLTHGPGKRGVVVAAAPSGRAVALAMERPA